MDSDNFDILLGQNAFRDIEVRSLNGKVTLARKGDEGKELSQVLSPAPPGHELALYHTEQPQQQHQQHEVHR